MSERFRQAMMPWRDRSAWVIAFSGGCDSRLLLELAAEFRRSLLNSNQSAPTLKAIHIDHGIHSDSGQWAQQCQNWCAALGVPLKVHNVELAGARQGLENLARQARYRVFEQQLGAAELLLMAHHQDDQAETLLLRLMRGAGVRGLSAMPQSRAVGAGTLLRPLLNETRASIEAEARLRGLSWIDDPSNADTSFDRNFVRHRMLPVLAERWPDGSTRLSKIAELQAETNILLSQYVQADLQQLLRDAGELDLAGLVQFSTERQRVVLRAFLASFGIEVERAELSELLEQCFAAPDRQPEWVFPQGILRRHRQRLCFSAPHDSKPDGMATPILWPDLATPLALGESRLIATFGGEFCPKGEVSIGWREPGMRCQLAGESHSRALKKLFQEWGIPQWRRQQVPLIFCDGELAAIADFAICEGFKGDGGWQLQWNASR
ncbi:tRNA lysidine(34) synthetase TilS [Spongiibacter sp. KMU-158]|uniref:tRNA(Ile)-lysidine synthase n=1 Tax=Spongiibacter pelagi TaxID=2760804 RepID=A0A927BZ70_9GAMM|nr:tRNA lysidine(34) synthetase TilS [Spongiibacter pelagi]MBD2858270.1 tRNA lysidine(34) synthetase TilS [Spongiibacter pelagi]